MTVIEIRKELVLRAPRERVWDALTTAEGWSSWFGESIEGEFQVGETMRQDFGEHGVCWAIVTDRQDKSVFAYQWHPGEDCDLDKYPRTEMTTVRFELSDHPDGTLLVMTESGFERIPESRRSKCIELNTEGWDWEIDELQAWVEQGLRHSRTEKH